MKKYRLNVVVEPLEDGRFLATSSDLKGCLAEGKTIAEAIENIEDAARVMIEFMQEQDWPLPPQLSPDEVPTIEAKVVMKPRSRFRSEIEVFGANT